MEEIPYNVSTLYNVFVSSELFDRQVGRMRSNDRGDRQQQVGKTDMGAADEYSEAGILMINKVEVFVVKAVVVVVNIAYVLLVFS